MRKWNAPLLGNVLLMGCCVLLAVYWMGTKQTLQPDRIALARLCDDIVQANGNLAEVTCPYPYAWFGADGQLLARSEDAPMTQTEAVQAGDQMQNLFMDGQLMGTVVLARNADLAYAAVRKQCVRGMLLLIFLTLANGIYTILYWNRVVMRPFRRMEEFATSVANGNLELPIAMDKQNVFGRFTESFDIMRTELQTARANEQAAVQAKKELIAQLSHDIKTPLTSIKTSAELLAAKSDDPFVLQKTGIMLQKITQMEGLVSDLFTESLTALGNLRVTCIECASAEIAALIRAADDWGRIEQLSIPDCVLCCDPTRLAQVFGNLLTNSYKYANTAITVSTQFSEQYLEISFLDYGQGVAEEQLPHLCEQYYRAGNVQSIPGAGLGLYIANHLMERMGGKLKLFCQGGFEAVVMIRLA